LRTSSISDESEAISSIIKSDGIYVVVEYHERIETISFPYLKIVSMSYFI